MKTAEEILNDSYYKELHSSNPFDIGNYNRMLILEAMKEYAIEVAKETLKNASENAHLDWEYLPFEGASPFVNKESILNENNIPEI